MTELEKSKVLACIGYVASDFRCKNYKAEAEEKYADAEFYREKQTFYEELEQKMQKYFEREEQTKNEQRLRTLLWNAMNVICEENENMGATKVLEIFIDGMGMTEEEIKEMGYEYYLENAK